MSENFHVPEEFLEEEMRGKKRLGQTIPKFEKERGRGGGGPYTAQGRKSRRDEVFRLHFDYGYFTRKISETLKVNTNTVNSDIKQWYSHLSRQDKDIEVGDMINKLDNARGKEFVPCKFCIGD